MATIPKPKLLNLNLDSQAVKKMLTFMGVDEQKEIAEKFILEIVDLYHDADGKQYVWEVATYYNNKSDRSYSVAVCKNPEIRFKEARFGLIRKKLREMQKHTKVRVTLQPNGSFKVQA